ncbi:acriflavine resistance protein [Actinobacillus equuli]|nr:acriflavine resistance protein [Actinobacillus equuli]
MAGNNLSGAAVLSALSANNLNTAAGNANGYYTVYKTKWNQVRRQLKS